MTLHQRLQFPAYEAPRIKKDFSTLPFRRILGIHANGHDASVSIVEDGNLIELIEFERVFREKHYRQNVLHNRYGESIKWLFEEYGIDPHFDAVAMHLHYFGSEPREYHFQVQARAEQVLRHYVPDAHYLQLNHHLCHAASGYFSSPFDEAIILSIDGHGNDGSCLGFIGKGNKLDYIKGWPFSLGRAYSALGNIVGKIHTKDGNSAGKVMGLTAYGSVVDEWKAPIRTFIESYTGIRSEFSPLFWEASIADGAFQLPGFGIVHGRDTFDGPEDPAAQNFATTFQEVWSDVVQDMVRELITETGVNNVCIVGGCALNATTNYDVLRMPEVADIHLIPHPNDEGISAGAALYTYYTYQGQPWQGLSDADVSPYLGVPILDRDRLDDFVEKRNAKLLESPHIQVAKMVANGEKIGVMQGRSEIGPRALGNRSIIADPRNPKMKDIINDHIKGREWYRPFAPVVREGEQDRYFDMPVTAPYMSYIAYVKPEWLNVLPSIVHADGTARVQTVTREQNPFIWDLLLAFEQLTGVGVLLNTSFNGRGEPIYARIGEALNLLDSTDLDAVFIDGYLFK